MVSPPCVSSRSHGLHGAWQRAGRGGYGEKNGPAKPCEGRSDPQTGRLEEETPTATSFPQGAHAVLEQGEFVAFRVEKMLVRFCLAKRAIIIKQPVTHNKRCICLSYQLCVQLCVKSELRVPRENLSKSASQYIQL